MTPPFHADQVGSLLRPTELREARARAKAGALSAEQLRTVENRAIERAVRKQEEIGLQTITGREFRSDFWQLDFLMQIEDIELVRAAGLPFDADDVRPMASVAGKVACSRPIM